MNDKRLKIKDTSRRGFLRPSSFVLCLAMVSLSGCMVGPDYEKPEVDTPAEWRYQVTDAADTVNTVWWNQFNDPVLDQLVDEALDNNKDVRIAAARVEEFAARVNIARSGLFPQFGYGASGERNKASLESLSGAPAGISRTSDVYSAAVDVGWELDLWGKIRRATEAARADLLAQEEARRTVILTLVSSVANSYIGLRALDRQLEITHRTLATRKDSLDLFELQFKGGVVSQLEVAQVRSEYEQAAVRVPAVERQIAVLENAISVLLGRNPGNISRGKSIDDLVLIEVPESMPSDLLQRRPDIRSSEQNLIAANAQIGVAKAQYFPSISLTGLFGYASAALSDLLSSSANLWGLNGVVLGPIFSGGSLTGQLRASEAVQRQVLIAYLQTVQNAFREVDDALIVTQKRREELAALGRQVDALKDYARLARLNYDEGQVSFIEVLDAERRLFDVELIEAQARSDVYVSLVTMYKVVGGGWVVEAEARASD
ncbi:MAG: efflux transporter outer membrane subunit [Arenicellales bacterium]